MMRREWILDYVVLFSLTNSILLILSMCSQYFLVGLINLVTHTFHKCG